MNHAALTALSPLDGRYHEKVDSLRDYFSEYALMRYRTIVEIRWLQALAQETHIPEVKTFSKDANQFLEKLIHSFEISNANEIKQIEKVTQHDVKAVEYFIKEKLSSHPELNTFKEFVHFACTSEDINNLSYALMLKDAREKVIVPTLKQIVEILEKLALDFSNISMLSRTHGQPATPSTLGKEFINVVFRLKKQITQLEDVKIFGKINGAVGNFNAHVVAYPDVDWLKFSKHFVEQLGLNWNPYTTQIEPHDFIAEYCHALARCHSILIDLCRDIWGYISWDYFKQKMKEGEVGSSTMPHKVNPIDFENAEGNLALANAISLHIANTLPISRFQRDLTDSTLLRNLGVGIGHGLLAFQNILKGLQKLEINTDKIKQDLNEHWEVLGEAIQTVMRRYHLEQPYERLKAFTRGKKITKELMQQFIEQLDGVPDEVKKQLLKLTPENYIGLAKELTRKK